MLNLMMTKIKKTNLANKKTCEGCGYFKGIWESKKPTYNDVSVIRNTNFTKDGFLNNSNIANLPVEVKQYEKRKLKFGDLILEKSGGGPKQPVGRIIIFNKKDGEYSFSNFTSAIRIRNKKELDFNFLHRFLYFQYISGVTETMQRRSTGIRNLQLKEYKQIQIPLPPLPEQKCIVKILDGVFEDVKKAKENAEKNLANAKELFESVLENTFKNDKLKIINGKWEEKKLGDKNLLQIIDGDRGKNYPKKSDFSQEGYCLFLNTKNVRQDGFDFQATMFITKKKDDVLGNGKLQRNDVLLTTRGTIGNIAVYDKSVNFENIRINSGMLIFRPNIKLIIPEYLFKIFQSGIMKSQIKKYVSGAAQPQLPIKTLVNFSIPVLKSLSEQKQIVKKLDDLSVQTKKLEKIYQQKIDDLEELKKAVLKKAFSQQL